MHATICLVIATTMKMSLVMDSKSTTSSQSLGQLVQILRCTKRTADLFVVEFVYWGGSSASVLQLLLVVHVGSSDRFSLGC